MAIFKNHHVMIFDDDPYMSKLLETILASFDFEKVVIAQDLAEAKLYLRGSKVDCIMLEWEGWEVPSLDLLEYVRKSGQVVNSELPVIMCTGYIDYDHVVTARDAGANEIVAKPLSPAQVYDKLYSAMFKVRNFIDAETFTGPDRRRHDKEYQGKERRAGKALPQSDIDKLMVNNDA